jgi:hypothetical protein
LVGSHADSHEAKTRMLKRAGVHVAAGVGEVVKSTRAALGTARNSGGAG